MSKQEKSDQSKDKDERDFRREVWRQFECLLPVSQEVDEEEEVREGKEK